MTLPTIDSSARAAPRERSANDWYREPVWAIEGLLDVQRFSGLTLDPACGSGTIPTTFEARGLSCHGADLVDRAGGDYAVMDFLTETRAGAVDNVVTNPPFDLAEAFLSRALRLARHKVAFLLRLSWLEGRSRIWVYDSTPLCAVHPFAARVSMPPGGMDIEPKGGAVAFAWYVWDHSHPVGAPAVIRRVERSPKQKGPHRLAADEAPVPG